MKHLVLAGLMAITLAGCSAFDWMVYKIDIPQGNFIEQSQVDKVELGMSREQIAFVLGYPIIRDSFDTDSWYYVYQFKNGRTNELTQEELVIRFKDDQVIEISGSYSEK